MSNFIRFFKFNSGKILLIVLFVMSILYNVASTRYINEVEKEIEYRDSIIKKMTFSDELVKRYFDISFDSIKNETSYTLKKEKLATITSMKRYIDNKPTEIVETTVITEQSIESLRNSIGELLHDYNILVRWANNKADSLEQLKEALELIKKNFDISYGVNKDKDKIRVYLLSDKADSAFMLLPYFRDKIQYDPNKKRWIIIRDRVVVK